MLPLLIISAFGFPDKPKRPVNEIIQWQMSPEFKTTGRRCASKPLPPNPALRSPSDCSDSSTTIKAEYGIVTDVLVINVVFHVIKKTDGTGDITDDLIQSQIDVLNEDYAALAGTPGEGGAVSGVQFKLATVDPQGNPTNGITRHTSNTYFQDPGPGASNPMKTALKWDPTKYLNIYTNDASGALGYATFPQEDAGKTADGVVLAWYTVGRDAPDGGIYNQGRTATHEVGHYLGLYHTFQDGCGTGYTAGDLIKDTPPQDDAQFECPSPPDGASCNGQPEADIHNYMNYTQDTCMFRFSTEQVNRIRCSILNYRLTLAEEVKCGDGKKASSEACDDGNVVDGDGCSKDCKSTEVCGNGILDTAAGEVCDDSNTKAGDGCRADCLGKELCGDGKVDPIKKEVCDDGNKKDGDGCTADCKGLEICGDGVIDEAKGEVCDDENTDGNDGCSKDCKSDETCGNGIVDADAGEECDDDGDNTCDATCKKVKKKEPEKPKNPPVGPVANSGDTGNGEQTGCACRGSGDASGLLVAAAVALFLLRRRRRRV